jgi:hypothetical protein
MGHSFDGDTALRPGAWRRLRGRHLNLGDQPLDLRRSGFCRQRFGSGFHVGGIGQQPFPIVSPTDVPREPPRSRRRLPLAHHFVPGHAASNASSLPELQAPEAAPCRSPSCFKAGRDREAGSSLSRGTAATGTPSMAEDHDGLRSSAYWRQCAEEARMMADEMRDPTARNTMLDIARMYDEMAERAAAREARQAER